MMRLNYKIFEEALFILSEYEGKNKHGYCCIALSEAIRKLPLWQKFIYKINGYTLNSYNYKSYLHYLLNSKHLSHIPVESFVKIAFPWWNTTIDNKFDYTSRYIALTLAAENCKEDCRYEIKQN